MSRATIYKCDVCDYSSVRGEDFASVWFQFGHTQNNVREVCKGCQEGFKRGFEDLRADLRAAALAGRGKG